MGQWHTQPRVIKNNNTRHKSALYRVRKTKPNVPFVHNIYGHGQLYNDRRIITLPNNPKVSSYYTIIQKTDIDFDLHVPKATKISIGFWHFNTCTVATCRLDFIYTVVRYHGKIKLWRYLVLPSPKTPKYQKSTPSSAVINARRSLSATYRQIPKAWWSFATIQTRLDAMDFTIGRFGIYQPKPLK